MADATYNTANGPRTTAQMEAELRAAGWPGSIPGTAGAGSVANAYAQTTGAPVTPTGAPLIGGTTTATTGQLGTAIDQFAGALAGGNQAQFQEMIREFNLNYANNVAQIYGQNYGPGNPAPQAASSLAQQQATGAVGYIPGYTGYNAGQSLGALGQGADIAQGAAGLTGFYAAPSQSAYTPGTFVRLDPSTYPSEYGTQISYVLPTGQLQRVGLTQARAMGWDGDLGKLPILSAQNALELERAPPQQLPQQTLQGLTTYSNLNTAAINQAIAQSQATGMYTAPGQILPPGTNNGGQKFSDLPLDIQRGYYLSNNSDWQAAQNKWVADSNAAGQAAYAAAGGQGIAPGIGAPGTPQETLAAQLQYFNEAQKLAETYGQYYAPGMPGSTTGAAAGPQAGQQTLAANEQYYRQALDAMKLASSLSANPFRQAEVMGQVPQLLSNQPVAGFQAPHPATGQTDFSGMGNMQRLIDDIRGGSGAVNSVSAQSVLDAIPTPNKVDSRSFLNMAPDQQNLILDGMRQKYGLDPTNALSQIKATLPAFSAPATYGTIK